MRGGGTGGQWGTRSSLRADQPAFREETCCEGGTGQWGILSSLRADQPAFREDTCCEGGQEVSGGSAPH